MFCYVLLIGVVLLRIFRTWRERWETSHLAATIIRNLHWLLQCRAPTLVSFWRPTLSTSEEAVVHGH